MKVKIILVLFVIETQCGVIDNVYDTMKNTTVGIRQDASNAWSYGRSIVGLETTKPEEPQQGLIGGVIQSTREVLSSVRNFFINPESGTDKGIIGNVIDRVRNGVSDITQLLTPPRRGNTPGYTENENTELIKESVDKLASGNRCSHGKACKEALEKLMKRIQELRKKMTPTTKSPVHYGEGMIDIRNLPNITRTSKSIDYSDTGVANDVFDKVDVN